MHCPKCKHMLNRFGVLFIFAQGRQRVLKTWQRPLQELLNERPARFHIVHMCGCSRYQYSKISAAIPPEARKSTWGESISNMTH